MRRFFQHMLVLLPAMFVVIACNKSTDPTSNANRGDSNRGDSNTAFVEQPKVAVEKPIAPLKLAEPPALPEELDGEDIKAFGDSVLYARARIAAKDGDYKRAATYQYWYVQKSNSSRYDLACYLARIGSIDAAFYWLQVAAIEEGVNPYHAKDDPDLASLIHDARFEKVYEYLRACHRYFEMTPIVRTVVVTPADYKHGTPIPVVLWLHGYRSKPEDFVDEDCQMYADDLNVAIVGVSGTTSEGPNHFIWADDPEKDVRRLRAALAEISDRVTLQKGCVITFGFSQGGQVAFVIAARFPDEFAGAIALSPQSTSELDQVKPSPLLARRGFVISSGQNENGVLQATSDAAWVKKTGAKLIHKEYAGVSAHAFPTDFEERFPEWIKFILKAQE